MAAFYRLPRCLFYIVGGFHRGRFTIVFARLPVRTEVKKIVHRMSQILFAAEIAFRRLDGYMPQQELNLLQLSAVRVAQLRAGSPQVMRCNMLQARSLAAGLDYVPHHILRDAFPPHLSRPGDGSKDLSLRNPGCSGPLIKRRFHPFWDGHGADVPTLADQVHHCPVPLTDLDLVQLQPDQLGSAKATRKKQGQHRVVALGTHAIATSVFEHFGTLLRAQPVAGAEAELFDSFHAADPRSQLGTQQACVGGLVSQAAHGRKLLVDGVRSQSPCLEVHAIADYDDAVEGEARLGAIPCNELINGVLVHAARGGRAEAIEHGRLAVVQIRQAKHSATVIRLDSLFAHDDGLPCRRLGTTAQTVWTVQAWR